MPVQALRVRSRSTFESVPLFLSSGHFYVSVRSGVEENHSADLIAKRRGRGRVNRKKVLLV